MTKGVRVIRFEDVEWMIGEGGWTKRSLISKNVGSEKMEMGWVWFAPGTRHPMEKGTYDIRESDEGCIVIRGTMNFYYKSQGKEIRIELKEGDTVFIPTDSKYRWENSSAEPSILIVGELSAIKNIVKGSK